MSDRKMNLLILVAGLGIGGAEVVIKHLVHALDRRRFNVTVCCIKTAGMIGEELIRDGVEVVVLAEPGRQKPDYLTFIKLRRLIRAKRIDIVHSHTTDALADAAVCRLLMPRLKLVHTFHFGNYPHADRAEPADRAGVLPHGQQARGGRRGAAPADSLHVQVCATRRSRQSGTACLTRRSCRMAPFAGASAGRIAC